MAQTVWFILERSIETDPTNPRKCSQNPRCPHLRTSERFRNEYWFCDAGGESRWVALLNEYGKRAVSSDDAFRSSECLKAEHIAQSQTAEDDTSP